MSKGCTFLYDSLHRVTQVTYPSGPNAAATPAKTFVYDSQTVDGTSMQHAAGRLAEAFTGPAGAKITDLGFNYYNADNETVYQSSLNSGGWYVSSQGTSPNGAVGTLNVPGAPAITYGLDGEGRPTTLLDGNGWHPVTAAAYSALGLTSMTLGSGDTDTYTIDPNSGRMAQYQFTVNGATDTGGLSWNSNGSLAQLAIADNIPGTSDTQTCGYTHDDLARISSVNCGSAWSQMFSFDPYGNLTKSGSQSFGATYNANNRISTDINFAPNYDANGNLLDDPISASRSVNAFDADGPYGRGRRRRGRGQLGRRFERGRQAE